MTKSELIERVANRQTQLPSRDVELAVKTMLEQMAYALASGERIEIRGFGSFSLHYRAPRVGRNPKTGEPVGLAGKHVPHFKPGKELRERVDAAAGASARTSEQQRDGSREPHGRAARAERESASPEPEESMSARVASGNAP